MSGEAQPSTPAPTSPPDGYRRSSVTPRVYEVPPSRPAPPEPKRKNFDHVIVLDVGLILFVCFGHVLAGHVGWLFLPITLAGLLLLVPLGSIALQMAAHPGDVSVRTRIAHVLMWVSLFFLGLFIRDGSDRPGSEGSIYLDLLGNSEAAHGTQQGFLSLSWLAVKVTVVAVVASHLLDRAIAWFRTERAGRRG